MQSAVAQHADAIAVQIEHIADGDLLILTCPNLRQWDVDALINTLASRCRDMGKRVTIVGLTADAKINVMTEEHMRRLGWIRAMDTVPA